ncbi:hypothetical protein DU002_15350 [Corallincola holothuriorum]|uniref:Uncharacterized protein n=1 Tax=Corallincola holothuriorum TaxID=2282215 RepID=A0A368N606_9GAMM|nr:hypothetical protein [Corallincola holothuriorum]RCU45433.1 hypothetical protein DU002_15350 [Corallincola holothuriorum]
MPIGSVYAAASYPVSNVTASTTSATLNTNQPQPPQNDLQQRQQIQQASDIAADQRVSGDPETSSALIQSQDTQASGLATTDNSNSGEAESIDEADSYDVSDSRRAAGAALNEANVAAQPRIDVFV